MKILYSNGKETHEKIGWKVTMVAKKDGPIPIPVQLLR